MTTAPLKQPLVREPGRTEFGRILIPLLFVEVFSGILQFYFFPLYPMIGEKYGVGLTSLTWTAISYTLAGAIATPLFAKLGDLYGHRKILKIELGLVAAGSVLIAIAPTFTVLLVGRMLQGTFPAFLPLMFGLVRERYDENKTRRAVAYLTAALLFGILLASVVVTLLVMAADGPKWVMWVPAVGTVLGFAWLWADNEPAPDREPGDRVDWTGLGLLALGLSACLVGLQQGADWGWSSPRVLALLITGAVVLVIWGFIEQRVSHPVADVRYLFRRDLLPVYVVGAGVFFGQIGTMVAFSAYMYMQPGKDGSGLGLSISQIALLYLPVMAVAVLGSYVTPWLGRKIGFSWVMTIGAAFNAIWLLGLVPLDDSLAWFLCLSMIGGAALGLIEGSTRSVIVVQLRGGEVSIGQSVYELSISIAGAVGAAVLGAVLASSMLPSGVPSHNGFTLTWAVAGVVSLISTGAGIVHALHTRRVDA